MTQMITVPFRGFLLKVASRCNLNCDYCYVYQHADQSWRDQPYKMSLATAAQLAKRINAHAMSHDLRDVNLIMHGGEPLLISVAYMRTLCETIRRNAPQVTLHFAMQTNGTVFNKEALDFCLEWNVRVGLSFDGPRHVNDKHRVSHGGQSSFDAVERALALLTSEEGRKIWSGFLSVIDIANDPLECYTYLKTFKPPGIDFLLPLCHYDQRPPGKEQTLSTTPYADWLLEIFDVWYHERPSVITIRRFRDLIALMLGLTNSCEECGLAPVDFIVVESNGSIQSVDSLKVTHPGATHLSLNIFDNSFDDALNAPMIRERQARWSSLCNTCQRCELVNVCGGGYLPHRYSRSSGFQNPSVYCADLTKLIGSIHATVKNDLKL